MAEDRQSPTEAPAAARDPHPGPHEQPQDPYAAPGWTDPRAAAGWGWGGWGMAPGVMAAPFGWALPPSAVPMAPPPLPPTAPWAPPPGAPRAAAPAPEPPPLPGALLPRLGLTAQLALDLVNAALAGGVRLLAGGVRAVQPGWGPGPQGCGGPGYGWGHAGCGWDCCGPLGPEPPGCCDYRVGTCRD